LETNGKELLTV